MSISRRYRDFLFEKYSNDLNEHHAFDKPSQIKYIMDNASAAGYPDLDNLKVLNSMTEVGVNSLYNLIENVLLYNDVRESSEYFISEKSDHDGWIVLGLDKNSKEFEVLSMPLIRKEAIRFLQSFETQMSKMSKKLQKYKKLKIAHASEVFESIEIEGEYFVNESKIKITKDEFPYLEFKQRGKLYKVDFDYGDERDNHGHTVDVYYEGEDQYGNTWYVDVVTSYAGDIEDWDEDSIEMSSF